MEIISTSRELTKQELYKMTKSPSILTVNHIEDGAILEVSAFINYTDTNSEGEENEILAVMGTDGTVWACQSATFKRAFNDLVSIFGNDGFSIKKLSGTTKAGRPYVNCDLAE